MPGPGSTTASMASKRGASRSVPFERRTSEIDSREQSLVARRRSASTMSSEKNWPCTSTAEALRPVRVCCETRDWIFAGKATSANGSSGSSVELSTIGRAYTGSMPGSRSTRAP